jgi:hypothetical protein
MNTRLSTFLTAHLPALLPLFLAAALPAMAQNVHFGGFGSASYSCFSSNTADFVVNDQPRGPGRSGRCDAGTDSLLGIQLDLPLGKSVEFGVQFVADRDADRSFSPDVDVAQVRWKLSDATTLRIGRMPSSAFLHTEDRQVRYAQPWVRPPLEVYGQSPVFSQDGLELIHLNRLGPWNAEWQGGIFRLSFDSPQSNSRETDPVKTSGAFLNLTLRGRNTLFKAGYSYSHVTYSTSGVDGFLAALRNLGGPSGTQLADELAIQDAPAHLFAFGVRHEQNDWLAMGEFSYRRVKGFFRDQYGAYATLGRRLGSWMPYGTLARRWTLGPDTDSRAVALGWPKAGVEALYAATRYDTTSASLGLSRSLGEQATLKLQADWIKPDQNSWGLYTNHGPTYDYANPGTDRLLTLSLDFVF